MSEFPDELQNLRQDYHKYELDEANIGDDPIALFKAWFTSASDSGVLEPNAMCLSTVDASNRPHNRMVLLKELEDSCFIFYTNLESHKGEQLLANSHAALLFFWPQMERQVRIEGIAELVSDKEADDYFESRPFGSKLGALASPQSRVIPNRDWMESEYERIEKAYSNKTIKRPTYWSGFRIKPDKMEFWQGRSNRLHDRIIFSKSNDGNWTKNRLAP